MSFAERHNALKKELEAYLADVFKDSTAPRDIIDAMEYSFFSGGKRLRPVMALYMAHTLGVDDAISMPVCAAIEMIHTYSLIHDDLPAMDDDDLRRGRATSHIKYGEGMAVLAGDGLLNSAFELMLKNCPEQECGAYIKAVAYIAECAGVSGMIGGQVLDIKAQSNDIEELKKMHGMKTGRMFSACIMPMVYIAHLAQNEEDAYLEFSQKFGLLFQITDDILDVKGSAQMLGKTPGKDAASGKITYVTKYGLDKASEIARNAADACIKALERTGRDNAYFVSLVEYTLKREN